MQRYGLNPLKSLDKIINDNKIARQEEGARIIAMAFANADVAMAAYDFFPRGLGGTDNRKVCFASFLKARWWNC